jgi:hypothetical protein
MGSSATGGVEIPTKDHEKKDLLSSLAQTHTKPLWVQMTRLNPPLPNPRTIPHVWRYEEIRPHLLRAGDLITEKEAERRVLMLVNPARGMLPSQIIILSCGWFDIFLFRCAVYDRHCLCWFAISNAERNGTRSPTYCFCDAVHYRGQWWIYCSSREKNQNAARRCNLDPDLELA